MYNSRQLNSSKILCVKSQVFSRILVDNSRRYLYITFILFSEEYYPRSYTMDDDENVVYIERQPLTQVSFDELYRRPEVKRSLWESVREKCSSSRNNIWLQISTLFPIVRVLRYYDIRRNLPTDILAGVATGLFYIPHSLAFGMLSSTKVENGLYTSIWPALIYALLGTSKHASVGTSAVICIYSASIIDRHSKSFQASYLMTSNLISFV